MHCRRGKETSSFDNLCCTRQLCFPSSGGLAQFNHPHQLLRVFIHKMHKLTWLVLLAAEHDSASGPVIFLIHILTACDSLRGCCGGASFPWNGTEHKWCCWQITSSSSTNFMPDKFTLFRKKHPCLIRNISVRSWVWIATSSAEQSWSTRARRMRYLSVVSLIGKGHCHFKWETF